MVFNGDVNDAVSLYLGSNNILSPNIIDLESLPRESVKTTNIIRFQSLAVLGDKSLCISNIVHPLEVKIKYKAAYDMKSLLFRVVVRDFNNQPIAMSIMDQPLSAEIGMNEFRCSLDLSYLARGKYSLSLMFFQGTNDIFDCIYNAVNFEVTGNPEAVLGNFWDNHYWGSISGMPLKLLS